jgi:hypothetical protein
MRHSFLVLAASTFLAIFAGCACNTCNCNQGNACPNNAAGRACHEPQGQAQQAAGPTAAVSYPYYTTRGPRDFLETHPQSIGP